MVPAEKRREYGSGSLYQRKSDWRWIGTVEAGWTIDGDRRRITVSAKGCEGGCKPRCPHRAAIKRKLEKKQQDANQGQTVAGRPTVKQWTDQYLNIRVRELTPKAYKAAESPLRNWVVPTVGHKRLADLTPADIRAVHEACREGDRQPADVHRVLMTMLRRAITEGHAVPQRVLLTPAPKPPKSDRAAMTIDEGLACLRVASELPHGSRWLLTLLYGQRKGECLGLTWDAIDFEAGAFGEIEIEWQLQSLPYKVKRDRSSGFRVPDGHESRHLVDAFHLVRPKTRAGYRVAPLLSPVRDALLKWREVAPENPWGLVWPTAAGRPANDKHDILEFHGLQNVAEVGHPVGRPYHVHECRNFAATMLLEADVPEHVITDLLGHSALVASLRYRTKRREPMLEALTRVGERLQLGQSSD